VRPNAAAVPDTTESKAGNGIGRPARLAVLLACLWLLVFTCYRLTDRQIRIIDVQAVIRLPISLWNDGNLDLEEFTEALQRFPGVSFVYDGRTVSAFPFWPALQIFPAYAIYGLWHGFPTEATVWTAQRRAAQASMALTVVLVGVMVGRRYGWRIAFVVGLAFGFGSINWFVLSQLCFSNGLVELWVALALIAGLHRLPPSRAAAAVSLVMLMVATFYRLNLAAFAAIFAAYLVARLRGRAVLPIAAAVAVGVAMAAANQAYMGQPLGLYGMLSSRETFPSPTVALALFGNLASPSRGLLVFSPWVLLAFAGLVNRRNQDEERTVAWVLVLGCLAHLVLTSNFTRWHGGGSMGPRLTADVLPAWAYLAAGGLAWCRGRRWITALAGLAIAASVVIAGAHAFSDSHRWEYSPVTADMAPDRLFDWRDALVLEPFRSTPYEDRYPIRLGSPAADADSHEPSVVFTWEDTRGRASEYLLDMSLRHKPRGIRVTIETFRAGAEEHLAVTNSSLPPTFDAQQPVAWRVRGLDTGGNEVARSAWRVLSWAPPIAGPSGSSQPAPSRQPTLPSPS